jgi:ATP-dependent RNA helicase SUPV3L1/SUV3
MEPTAVRKLGNLRRGDAVICFSRREVLMWRDMVTELGLSVATVYGNLSPEVRRAQAQRFREAQPMWWWARMPLPWDSTCRSPAS